MSPEERERLEALCAVRTDEEIGGFFGEYKFLSNFFMLPSGVYARGKYFPSSEHAYMYAKVEQDDDDCWYEHVLSLKCGQVKKWGRGITLRPYWDDMKYGVMREIVLDKFARNEEIRAKLIETGSKRLVETNHWSDVYWGVDIKKGGQNNLGKILMEVRDILTR